MSTRRDLICARLRDEGQKTAALFRGLDEAAFSQQVYTTGPNWCVRDVLAHLVSAEQTFTFYGQDILAGGQGAPEGFVIDEYNAAQVGGLRDAAPASLIGQFEAARAATLDMVGGMSEADLDRLGRHPWFGQVPVENMCKLIYRHTMLHERDVRRALETGQPVAHVDARPPAG
ncbi:MAG: DinB family protein [Anaerolineales bacterium]|nr:DinB family protein [Anaerolineales bacterium]